MFSALDLLLGLLLNASLGMDSLLSFGLIDHVGSDFAAISGIPLMAKVFVMMYGLASLSLSLI